MTTQLRRHDLVWLSSDGWARLVQAAPDTQAADCLEHWWVQRLPLVVGRQAPEQHGLSLGLAAPVAWDRRKVALQVPHEFVLYHGCFPKMHEVARQLPGALRPLWTDLGQSLAALGTEARVHGSCGWQQLTGLRYLTATSDIDVLLPVADAQSADAVAAQLDGFDWDGPRIDGELLFANGGAVAWREWLQWRGGRVDRVMVKRLQGVTLESGLDWLQLRTPVAA